MIGQLTPTPVEKFDEPADIPWVKTPEEVRRKQIFEENRDINWNRLKERLVPRVERLLYQPITRLTLAWGDDMLRQVFDRMRVERDLCIVHDGLQIVGATVFVISECRNVLGIRYVGDFWPKARHAVTSKKGLMPLGFRGDSDLYVAEQGDLPPALLARYGNDPSEYISITPAFMDLEAIDQQSPEIREAFNRAISMRYDLKLSAITLHRLYGHRL